MSTLWSLKRVLCVDLILCSITVSINWVSPMCCVFIALLIKWLGELFPWQTALMKNSLPIIEQTSWQSLIHKLSSSFFIFTGRNWIFLNGMLCYCMLSIKKKSVLPLAYCVAVASALLLEVAYKTGLFLFLLYDVLSLLFSWSYALKKKRSSSALTNTFSGSCFPSSPVSPLKSGL